LGDSGGAGHLIICNIVRIHIAEHVVDEHNRINPHKLDLVGRLGRAYYTRVSGDSIFTVAQSQTEIVMGFDALPISIKESNTLTGNNLGQLAGLIQFPEKENIDLLQANDARIQGILAAGENVVQNLHQYAKEALDEDNIKLGSEIAFLAAHV
jgi:hypothetical protein